ncbi:MAG: arylamine N-acetyltransferase family protein [Usitatibacter sp.]
MEEIDLEAYFARVGYEGPAAPTLATLSRLHALHAAAIPFENLSPFLGEPVRLDAASLQDKLVARRRGGWCFEHNLLFSHALETIGFELTRLAARVRWNVPAGVVTPRSHCLMRVRVEGRDYIADVGFGGLTLTAPLRLEDGIEQDTPHEPHRIVAEGAGHALEARVAGEWQRLYTFEMHEQLLADYEVSNWYLCHHPQSHFVTGLMAARASPTERHALRNTRYSIHRRDGRTERRVLASAAELRDALAGPFQVALPQDPNLDAKLASLVESHRES